MQHIDELSEFCMNKDISIHPLVASPNETVTRDLLETAQNQENFFQSLTNEIQITYMQGINIDIEGIPNDLREEFTSYFADLKFYIDENHPDFLLSIAKNIARFYDFKFSNSHRNV